MKKARFAGWQARLRQTSIALPLVSITISLYLLARGAFIAPMQTAFVSSFWVVFAGFGLVGLLVGLYYILAGPLFRHIYWATIFASADLGLLIGGVLYLGPLRGWVLPQFQLPETNSVTQALWAVGVLDGLLVGAINGFIVSALDEKATSLTLAGATRFISVSCFVMVAMIVTLWVENSSKLGDIFSPLLFLLLCGAIRWGINWLDRKSATNQ